jgi:ribonuclease T1
MAESRRLPSQWMTTLAIVAGVVAVALIGGAIDEDDGSSDLEVVQLDELPPEVGETIGLIRADGPYPYDEDGVVFGNREDQLPDQPTGYYREYTVETPGSSDRGPRRVITGEAGEVYYTEDHYASFVEVDVP